MDGESSPEASTHWSSRLAGDHSWSPAFLGSGAIGNVTGEGEGDPDGADHRRCSAELPSGSPIPEMSCVGRQYHVRVLLCGGRDDPLLLPPSLRGQLRVG